MRLIPFMPAAVWFLLASIPLPSAFADTDQFVGDWLFNLTFKKYHQPVQFKCSIAKRPNGDLYATITNGSESIPIEECAWENEELVLRIAHYGSELKLQRTNHVSLTGSFVRARGESRQPVTATVTASAVSDTDDSWYVPGYTQPASCDRRGRWRVTFKNGDTAVAIIKDEEATFLTDTGDYRYLGRVRGAHPLMVTPYPVDPPYFAYSVFDGAHAFRFDARVDDIEGECKMTGKFFYAPDTVVDFTAVRDDDATLPDGFSLTTAKRDNLAGLTFPNLEGNKKSLSDLLDGHPGIIEIFGSWCPNCHDAAKLLAELDQKHRDKGLRIIGLAFEYADDFDQQAERVKTYLARHNIDFPVLIAGEADKANATASLDLLDRVRAYPTFLFVDRTGKIRAIYSGFSGPATGAAHDKLKAAFENQLEQLLRK